MSEVVNQSQGEQTREQAMDVVHCRWRENNIPTRSIYPKIQKKPSFPLFLGAGGYSASD